MCDDPHKAFDAMVERVLGPKLEEERQRMERWRGVLAAFGLEQVRDDLDDATRRILLRCSVSTTGCWEWGGALSKKGYGRIKVDRRLVSPHRVIAVATGILRSMRDRRLTMHICDNPLCVNPAHLKAGTHKDNMQDCADKGRLHAQKTRGQPRKKRRHVVNCM